MDTTVGDRIREVRKNLKMNQTEFASELGVSQNHISSIENGKENASGPLQKLICTKFDVDEEWLKSGIGGMLKGFDPVTDEGLMNKYTSTRFTLDQIVKRRSGIDRNHTVLAVAFLTGLLTGDNIKEEYLDAYLKAIFDCIDTLERLEAYTITKTRYGKMSYENMFNYQNEAETRIKSIEKAIRSMLNVIFQQQGITNLKM